MTLTIPVAMAWGNTFTSWKDVTGELLPDIAPHLSNVATFIVSREVYGRLWQITNVETGYRIGDPKRYKKDAIRSAKNLLARKSARQMLNAMRRAMREFEATNA